MPFSSRDKAYVPGAKPKVDMPTLDKELQELVAELQPTPEERQRQQVYYHFTPCGQATLILTLRLHVLSCSCRTCLNALSLYRTIDCCAHDYTSKASL